MIWRPAAGSPGRRLAVAGSLLAGLTVLAGCSPAPVPSPSPSATPSPAAPSATPATTTPQPTLGRAEGWRSDLAALVPAMAALHPNLFHGTSRAELDAAVAALSATVDTATDDELLVGVLRITAAVSEAGCDGQTGANPWTDPGSAGSQVGPVGSLPLRLWLFDDDVVVVDALPQQHSIVGSRIDAVEDHPIAEVLAAIDPLVPRDNGQTARLVVPRFLLTPRILRGLGLADDGPITLSLVAPDGASSTVDLEPISRAAYDAWAGTDAVSLPADPAVRYLSRLHDSLWWERLSDGETLYVQLNRVEPIAAAQLAELDSALRADDVARVVLDLRHNPGGEPDALEGIAERFEDPAVARANRLYVLMSRSTRAEASQLVARLERNTPAVLVGEAMGGCPTAWASSSTVVLPWSGLEVNVASDVAVGVDPDDPRLTIEPDVRAVLTREEWADGDDPALGLFIGIGP